MKKHLIDELDLFIFKEIFNSYKNKEECNTWEVSKKYSITLNKKTQKEIDNIYRIITSRIKNYCDIGIFIKKFNGEKKIIFEMDLDKITFSSHKFSDGFHQCLLIRI